MSTDASYPVGPDNKVRRYAARGHYDHDTVHVIIDEALFCHVAFIDEGKPVVIPMLHARRGSEILIHGAPASRLLKSINGHPLSIAFTLVDGIVAARSAFHSSMNYRSAVVFGSGRLLTEYADKFEGFRAFTEHVIPGRWADARMLTEKEVHSTSIISVMIDSASAKIRSGPPVDDEEDYALPIWAGVVPAATQYGVPQPDPRLAQQVVAPDYLKRYTRGQGGK